MNWDGDFPDDHGVGFCDFFCAYAPFSPTLLIRALGKKYISIYNVDYIYNSNYS